MIPRDFITEWRAHAPWVQDFQIEQDLVSLRVQLVEGCAARGKPPTGRATVGKKLRSGRDWDTGCVRGVILTGGSDVVLRVISRAFTRSLLRPCFGHLLDFARPSASDVPQGSRFLGMR